MKTKYRVKIESSRFGSPIYGLMKSSKDEIHERVVFLKRLSTLADAEFTLQRRSRPFKWESVEVL